MNTEFVFVADRGTLKIYLWKRSASLRLEFVEGLEIPESRRPFAEDVTDQAGGFPNTGSEGNANSIAERQGIEREKEARSIRRVAEKINEVLGAGQPCKWSLAAPSTINGMLLARIETGWRNGLVENVEKDLVNVPAGDLASHFHAYRGGRAEA